MAYKDKEKEAKWKEAYKEKNREIKKIKAKEYREKNKEHIKEKGKEYGKNNREKLTEYGRVYRKKNKERLAVLARERYIKNKVPYNEHKKEGDLIKRYGMSISEYNELLGMQGGVCAICGNPEVVFDKKAGKTRCLSVDHSHTTGAVRGLLCRNCNVAIGLLKDDPEILLAAAGYLLNMV